MSDAGDKVRRALEGFRAAGHAVEASHAGSALADAVEALLSDSEWDQRVSVPMPRRRREDGVWITTSPGMIDGTTVRELGDAQSFIFEFADEMIDDYMGREIGVLLQRVSSWLMCHPEVTVLGVGITPGREDARSFVVLTVEGMRA